MEKVRCPPSLSVEYRNTNMSNLCQFYCPDTAAIHHRDCDLNPSAALILSYHLPPSSAYRKLQIALKPGKYSADGHINLFCRALSFN